MCYFLQFICVIIWVLLLTCFIVPWALLVHRLLLLCLWMFSDSRMWLVCWEFLLLAQFVLPLPLSSLRFASSSSSSAAFPSTFVSPQQFISFSPFTSLVSPVRHLPHSLSLHVRFSPSRSFARFACSLNCSLCVFALFPLRPLLSLLLFLLLFLLWFLLLPLLFLFHILVPWLLLLLLLLLFYHVRFLLLLLLWFRLSIYSYSLFGSFCLFSVRSCFFFCSQGS